jgi:hypothetical protein
MSGGFSNPIIGGGGNLVYPSIHSPGYVPDITGWSINKDGTADFTGLTVRGQIIVESSNDGIFVYTYIPA